ncbi:DNase I-like protein [Hesseltinella vesiculosa]|uniref:DNase I-like protein n=1 Tax=Hesseltinella vesiculosa TaxID=101127 RepID=A0A1X2GUM6_9FUNG|nr:DNase I-like protein [Hesseltinella vesiculosa]
MPPLDPATIEERRQKKRAEREAKRKEQQQHQPPAMPIPFQRTWQTLATSSKTAQSVSVMSYNILAQALCQRELFPHAGNMLKWKTRRKMIVDEIAYYRPQLLCLQEVDNYDEFYKAAFAKLGYQTTYHRHETKRQGCMIGYLDDEWKQVGYETLDYDTDPACPATQFTGNVAQMMALTKIERDCGSHESGESPALPTTIILGNTHLYWRPPSTYERCRQGLIYHHRLWEMQKTWAANNDQSNVWPVLCGDLNTQPSDPLYALLTGQPLSEYQMVCMESTRRSFGDDDHDFEPPTDKSVAMDPAHASDAFSLDQLVAAIGPLPDQWMKSAYNHHGRYHESHVGRYKSTEPDYTIFAHVFKGTLDYILVPRPITPTQCLLLPPYEKMSPAIPNESFGSDHLSLVAQLSLPQ